MGALPGYDQLYDEHDLTSADLTWMAITQYLTITFFTGLLVLALRNAWVIFVKLGRYGNVTLLSFYLLVVLAIMIRIETLIWFWTAVLDWDLYSLAIQPIVKLHVGLIMAWTIIELTLRVEISINQLRALNLT